MKESLNSENLENRELESVIRKSNVLIRSQHNLTTIEHRIISLAVSQISEDDTELKTYRVEVSTILGFECLKNYSCCSFKKTITRLQTLTISIYDNSQWVDIHLFETLDPIKQETLFLDVTFHQDMKKYLLDLKSDFTAYPLKNVMQFKSKYSFRIYELCKQYQNSHEHKISVKLLKSLLQVEEKYIQFCDFHLKILIRPVQEINFYSDLDVNFTVCKNNPDKPYIIFSIEQKKQKDTLIANDIYSMPYLKLLMQEKCVAEKSCLLEQYKTHSSSKSLATQNLLKVGRDENIQLPSQKINSIVFAKKLLVMNLDDKIFLDRRDLKSYQETRKFHPGDIFRFKNKNIDDVINLLETRIVSNLKDLAIKKHEYQEMKEYYVK